MVGSHIPEPGTKIGDSFENQELLPRIIHDGFGHQGKLDVGRLEAKPKTADRLLRTGQAVRKPGTLIHGVTGSNIGKNYGTSSAFAKFPG